MSICGNQTGTHTHTHSTQVFISQRASKAWALISQESTRARSSSPKEPPSLVWVLSIPLMQLHRRHANKQGSRTDNTHYQLPSSGSKEKIPHHQCTRLIKNIVTSSIKKILLNLRGPLLISGGTISRYPSHWHPTHRSAPFTLHSLSLTRARPSEASWCGEKWPSASCREARATREQEENESGNCLPLPPPVMERGTKAGQEGALMWGRGLVCGEGTASAAALQLHPLRGLSKRQEKKPLFTIPIVCTSMAKLKLAIIHPLIHKL